MEATLAIIKPDAVRKKCVGRLIALAEENGLSVVAMRLTRLTKRQAEGFYYVHRDRPFFGSLTDFMSEGPIVPMVLRGENAIARWREVMGATDPEKADEGTIRKLYGSNIERNAVHGSDSPESARFEIGYFFSALELA